MITKKPFATSHLVMTASIVVIHTFWWCIVVIFLNKIYDTLDLANSVSKSDRVYFNVAVFSYIQLSTSTQILGICTALVLKGLNNALENCMTNPKTQPYFDVIRISSLIYIKVSELCDNFSIVFTLLLLPFLMIFLFYNLLLTYGCFVYQMNPSDQLYLFSLLAFIFVCLYAPTTLVLFSVSNLILSSSGTTIDLVQQVIAKRKNVKLQRKCNNLVLLLAHTKPVWSLMLFEVHWKSFFAMLGVIFSYSVILVQFYDVSNE